jgi:molybdopterin converting factor small subunit
LVINFMDVSVVAGIYLTNPRRGDSLKQNYQRRLNIKIKLNDALQPFSGNRAIVEVDGDTVKDCLDGLIALYPTFREIIFDAQGALSALVLFEGSVILPGDLDRPISRPGEITLMPMVQGG